MKVARSEAENPVIRAVTMLGGPTEASHICKVSAAAIYKWRRSGICPDTRCAVLLSEATRGAVTIRELAGMEPKPDPTGRGAAGLVEGDAAYAAVTAEAQENCGREQAFTPEEEMRSRPRRLYMPPSDQQRSSRRHVRTKKGRYSRYISIPLLHQAAIEALLEVLGHSVEDDELLAWAA